jgi:hypothetical protein
MKKKVVVGWQQKWVTGKWPELQPRAGEKRNKFSNKVTSAAICADENRHRIFNNKII